METDDLCGKYLSKSRIKQAAFPQGSNKKLFDYRGPWVLDYRSAQSRS